MIWKVTLNGTLADFDEAAQAAAKAALVVTFNQPSITAEHITLTVEAGSIIVTGEVRLEDPSVDFTALKNSLSVCCVHDGGCIMAPLLIPPFLRALF